MGPWEDRFDEMTRRSEDVRRKMFVDAIREKNPQIDPTMVYLTPGEVMRAMESNERTIACREAIAKEFAPSGKAIALIFPDSERKPWTKGSTESLSFRNLYAALRSLNLEGEIEVFALSPMIGLVPERYFTSMPMYETSGLQSFMVKRRGLPWNQDDFKGVISRSSVHVGGFLAKHHSSYKEWHAIYRIPSIHERVIESVMESSPYPLWKHTSKKPLSDSYLEVRKIIEGLKR